VLAPSDCQLLPPKELPRSALRIFHEEGLMTALELLVRSRLAVSLSLMIVAVSGFATQNAVGQDSDGAGVVVSGKATSADVGLSIYPGAKPYKEPNEDSGAARLRLWGGAFGFKVAAMKMESSDAPIKIADFYRKELAKYGKVLDCTNGGTNHDDSSNALTCDGDKPNKDRGMLFKAGTKTKQHIVAIDPNGNPTTFALVYIWVKGE
jgi:hypothetical protein